MTARVVSLFPWPQLSADSFDAFWQLYPRRVAKVEAQRAWARLNGADRAEVLKRLPLFVDDWATKGTEPQFIPHAATFLRGRRWEDELAVGLGQCEWNRNGNREPGANRCDAQAHHTSPQGHVYCPAHAVSLGMVRRKA